VPPKTPKGVRKTAKVAPAKAKVSKTTNKAATAAAPRTSKKAVVIDTMKAKGGATLDAIIAETGWAKHTIPGFISTAGKTYSITSEKTDAGRTYRIAK
jgi:TusA-related sulfurtransferase